MCEIEVSADTGYEGRLAPWFGDSLVRGQRFVRYAAAYAAAGGLQQALVEQWKKTIDR